MKKKASFTLIGALRLFPNRWLLVVALICTTVSSLAMVLTGHLLRVMVDAVIMRNSNQLTTFFLLAALLEAIRSVISFIGRLLRGRFSEEGIASIRERVFASLGGATVTELQGTHSADYISRLTNDLNSMKAIGSDILFSVFHTCVTGLGALIYLSTLNLKLTIVMLTSAPVLIALGITASTPLSGLGKVYQERLSHLSQITQDAFGGIETLKGYQLEGLFGSKFANAADEVTDTSKAIAGRESVLSGISSLIGMAPFLLMFGLGGYWSITGEMTAGSLVAFVDLFSYLTMPLNQLPGQLAKLRLALVSSQRIADVLGIRQEKGTGTATTPADSANSFEIRGLSFSYPGRTSEVLKKVNLTIRKGEKVAIVGASGSGKSTLIRLMLGLYTQYTGEIIIMGRELRAWNLSAMRRHLSFMSQDAYLFPFSIGENIALGRPQVSTEDLLAASHVAKAHDFITTLPDKYNTPVGELGNRLSGGQKQRIALARAVVRNAPILLLDEPTSSLDKESQKTIQKTLSEFIVDKTCVVVSHNLETVQSFDRIVVLENGEVVEYGNHEELLSHKLTYYRLYLTQSQCSKEAL